MKNKIGNYVKIMSTKILLREHEIFNRSITVFIAWNGKFCTAL